MSLRDRWIELIEDDNHRLSSTRTTMLYGSIILSLIIFALIGLSFLFLTPEDASSLREVLGTIVAIAGIFAGLCCGVYAFGKGFDSSVRKAAMNPAPEPVQIPQPLGPTTIINTGSQPPVGPLTIPAADVNVTTEKGNVNVAGGA